MIRLSAFADEISPDLDRQIVTLEREGIRHIELRSVRNVNVLDLTDPEIIRVKQTLDARGITVSAIGSPIGKVPVDHPTNSHEQRFERAIAAAHAFETPYVRLFSFYPPDSRAHADPALYRDEVVRRLRAMAKRAAAELIVLLHENEKDIYGDTISRCVDLMEAIDSANFGVVLDPANFIQCGQTPYPDAYDSLKPWLRYIHVKDALPDGQVVPAGEGAANWPDFLRRLLYDGYDGFFSLEPHLAATGPLGGFSGPDLFRHASQSFQQLLRETGWGAV